MSKGRKSKKRIGRVDQRDVCDYGWNKTEDGKERERERERHKAI